MEKLNVMGICAGNGTCLYTFKGEHFNILGNVEPRSVFYDKSNYQWPLNFGKIPKQKDFIDTPYEVDIVIGHPDCGHSSKLRLSRAKSNVPANENVSVKIFLEGINRYQPKVFLLENLPKFSESYPIPHLKVLLPGYDFVYHVESVSKWGNSQKTRIRLVIVGWKKDYFVSAYPFRNIIAQSDLKYSRAFELPFSEDAQLGHMREPMSKTCNLYWGEQRKITYEQAREIWNDEYRDKPRWFVGGKMNNQPGVSRNLANTFPTTVRKQNRQFNSKGLVLSPREMANIQGVPQSFKMSIPKSDKLYWINKWRTTVTKAAPYEISKWFKTACIRVFIKSNKNK